MLEVLFGDVWGEGEALLRLVLAAVLGGVVGLERERSGKPAGFRTNLLICVGAALLTDLSVAVASEVELPGGFRADPGRIAAQIVSGIGFLGAGTIIQARGSVYGLTTAASMWVVAAIGMAVGAGQYLLAVSTTLLVIVALLILGRIELRMHMKHDVVRLMQIELQDESALERIEALFSGRDDVFELVELERTDTGVHVSYQARGAEGVRQEVVRSLLEQPGVRRVSMRRL